MSLRLCYRSKLVQIKLGTKGTFSPSFSPQLSQSTRDYSAALIPRRTPVEGLPRSAKRTFFHQYGLVRWPYAYVRHASTTSVAREVGYHQASNSYLERLTTKLEELEETNAQMNLENSVRLSPLVFYYPLPPISLPIRPLIPVSFTSGRRQN